MADIKTSDESPFRGSLVSAELGYGKLKAVENHPDKIIRSFCRN